MNFKIKILAVLSVLLFIITSSYANPPIEVQQDGSVSINSQLTANEDLNANKNLTVNNKLNIKNVLHLDPLSSPPANPQEGDIYFTATKELLLYANGKWTPIVAAQANPGTAHITSGSGNWTVPAGIYNIRITLIGGGGGGSAGSSYKVPGDDQFDCVQGLTGGKGGVRLHINRAVVPGQQISYAVGAGGTGGKVRSTPSGTGGTTYFGDISATGGKGANQGSGSGSPAGVYPYSSTYGQGGAGGTCSPGGFNFILTDGATGAKGAIYIEY